MKVVLNSTVRLVLYVGTVLGAPVVVYLRAKNIIGDLELTLWGAEVSAVSLLAAFHVPAPEQPAAPPTTVNLGPPNQD